MTNTLPLPPDASRFRWLALGASLSTFALIVIGGIVRVTGSGMGCGEHWPLCNGVWFPPLDVPTAIELSHRLAAALVTPLVLATAFAAWRRYRTTRWIVVPALLAALLLIVQILLGAATVLLSLPPAIVALHLANALALLALLLVATVMAFQHGRDPRIGQALFHFDTLSSLVGVTTLGLFVLLITGALVTAGRAGFACAGWPLCNGNLAPTTAPEWLHMGHRYAAGLVGLLVAGSVIQAWRLRRDDGPVFVAAIVTGALFLAQVLVGGLNVLRGFPVFLNGLHIATGSAVWAGMVVFSILSMQYVRLSPLRAKVLARTPGRGARVALADYFALTKPIIMLLLLMTTVGAMIVAGHGWPPADLLLWTLLGGALASGGASALNQVIDRELDQHMARTARRPLAAGRIDTAGGLAFGLVLSIASFYVLAVYVNPLSAVLALFGNVYYVLGYSILLKKTSVQNIVIGGGAGAVPPLVGWAAATGRIGFPALFLFALVFFWTPPHFWALALLKKNDYARAGVPMLPVIYGELDTRRHILMYTLLVVALSLLLTPAHVAGFVYLAAAAVLGAGFIAFAVLLLRQGGNKVAWQLYKYSSLYLALMFAALVVDRLVSV